MNDVRGKDFSHIEKRLESLIYSLNGGDDNKELSFATGKEDDYFITSKKYFDKICIVLNKFSNFNTDVKNMNSIDFWNLYDLYKNSQ